jgi:DNA-directed RNA polymerase specialized sigma24 family protein
MNEPRTLPTSEPDLSGVLDWGATLAEHDRWLRRVVASRLGEPQAVDEVIDVALAAVARRSPLHNPAWVAVWLYRLAVPQVLIYRRKTGRQRSLVDRYAARKDVSEIDAPPSPLEEHEKTDASQVGRPSRDGMSLGRVARAD